MWTTLHFGGSSKTEKQAEEIYKGTPDIEFEQHGSVGLGAILTNGQKIKNYLSSFRDFSGKSRKCHIVGLRIYYKPTKFNQNRWNHFWENQIFLVWTTLNFKGRSKTRIRARDIC